MAVSSGPKITKDGLVLYLDAANFKSNKGKRSLINWNDWVSGSTGSTGAWGRNGLVEENERTLDINPFGNVDVIWDTPSNDADSGGDGGWNIIYEPIDPTKMYRFTTWMKRRVIGNGSSYLGTYGFENNTNVGVLYRSSGVNKTNPYFKSTGWWGSANTWYLVIGHVWPYGSGTGANHQDTGVWNLNGTLASSCADFVWKTLATNRTSHRSYLFYSTDTTTSQQWYQPRIDLCDGTEPTLQELLNDVGNKVTDLTGLGNNGIATGSVGIDTDNRGSFIFDGVDDYIDLDITNDIDQLNGSDVTICAYINADSISSFRTVFTARGGNTNELFFGIYANQIYLDRYPPSGNGALSGLYPSTNQWNFVAVSATHTSSATFCLNGQFNTVAHTETYTGGTPTKVTIGAQLINGVASRFFDGKISNVMVFNRALTQAEIKQIYEATRARYGL